MINNVSSLAVLWSLSRSQPALFCRSSWCHQNRSDSSGHRLHTPSEGVLWFVTPRLYVLYVREAGRPWFGFSTFHRCSIRSGEIWRPSQHHEFFVMFLKPCLNNLCTVAGSIKPLKDAIAIRKHMTRRVYLVLIRWFKSK